MPTITRSVALVGRPNVGKSRLFNRLAGRRISIVHDQPGVTRDLITVTVPPDRGGYLLMDTGGIGLAPGISSAAIVKATEEQVDFALAAAGLVLFVTDTHAGLTGGDERIAERLRAFRKPTILVANKADDARREAEAQAEFTSLGFGEVVPVSAEHGHGVEELMQRISQILGPPPAEEAPDAAATERIKFALIGRPNVGKSSLGNALLSDKRLIVNETPGTTRDTIEINFDFTAPDGGPAWPFTILDTAGLRPRPSVKTPVEFFSQNRSREAIEESDVVFLVLDALEGVTKQDKVLAGDVLKAGKGLVIVVNKWDIAQKRFEKEPLEGYANVQEFRKSFLRAVERNLFFMPLSPVLFTSAHEGIGVTDILREARTLFATMKKKLPTGALNRVLQGFMEVNPPKFVGMRRFKCYYAVQVARHPFVFRLYCNHAEKMDEGYSRHLAAGVQTAFKLNGCPIRFELVGKPPRAEGTKFTTKFNNAPRPGNYPHQRDQTARYGKFSQRQKFKHQGKPSPHSKSPSHGKKHLPRIGQD
jgi:GTPase